MGFYSDNRSTGKRVGSGDAFAVSVCVYAELAQQLRRSPSHHVNFRIAKDLLRVERATAELDKS